LPSRAFFGAPACPSLDDLNAQVAFLGVPYDHGTYVPVVRSGTFGGPNAVRDAYTYLNHCEPDGTSAGWFDIEDERMHLQGVTMADCGDVVIAAGESLVTLDRITEISRRIAARDALVVAVGGDHSISFPVGRGVMERREEVSVVHIDAHPDFRNELMGSRYSHGSNLRRLSELPFVRQVTALGLRVVDPVTYEDMKGRVDWATTRDILEKGPAVVVEQVVPPAKYLYVSIDIDVLDLAIVPGTTLPEPGGISYRELRGLLAALPAKGEIVGFDIVELNSAHDYNNVTARITAMAIVHFLSAIFDHRAPAEGTASPTEAGASTR
jgi:agmatinase